MPRVTFSLCFQLTCYSLVLMLNWMTYKSVSLTILLVLIGAGGITFGYGLAANPSDPPTAP